MAALQGFSLPQTPARAKAMWEESCGGTPMLRYSLSTPLSLVLFCLLGSGQAPSPTSQSQGTTTIRSTSSEVLLDLVVRDKHHHAITNLRADEVEVLEDGVAQNIRAFHAVAGAEELQTERDGNRNAPASPDATTGSPSSVTPLHQMNFVAIVFGDIAPLNLEFARQAVQEFLKSDNLPNTYVSIYRLGRTLTVARFYTDDKELLSKSVDSIARGLHTDDGLGTNTAVVGGAYSSLQAVANNLLNSPNTTLAEQEAVRNAVLNPLPTIARDPLLARDTSALDASFVLGSAILAQARIENGIRFATSLSEGMNTIDSLHEIVRGQENLPGRKLVLYLADGLSLPMNRRDAVDNLISYANRAGVAFYGVDTRGLNIEDPMMRSLAEQERTGAISSSQTSDPMNGVKEDDSVQLTAVTDRQLALRELAESTGGFSVTDTNEIALPMQRVMEDIRFHYEVAYRPVNTSYDGHFRKIEVKIRRPKVSVQTRKGYFALPDLNGQSLQPFEAAALNAINGGSTPKGPSYRLAVMKFRPHPNAVEHQVAFEVPLTGLKAVTDKKSGRTWARLSLFAVIRDHSGQVVGKIGRELTRDLSQASGVKEVARDQILYAEPVELAPGHYRIDAVVTDEQSAETSVKRLAFFVPTSREFGLSSIELVKGRETSSATPSLEPVKTTNVQIVPTLADSVSSGKDLDLYFVLYPEPSDSHESPRVVLQVLHDGRELVRKPLELPHPDVDGSIPVRLKFSPSQGQCDILVSAQQGRQVAQSSLSVRVE